MKTAVCIKQVPGTSQVEIDPVTGVLKRDGVESKMNPYDLYALETALRFKQQYGAELTAVTMGPPQAKAVIKEAFILNSEISQSNLSASSGITPLFCSSLAELTSISTGIFLPHASA